MSGKKRARRKSTAKTADKGKNKNGTNGKNGDKSAARSSSSRTQSPKETGPGADSSGKGTIAREGFDLAHGRYRDEVVDTDPTVTPNVIVRRTFLASKTEFEVEVPRSVGGGPGEARVKWEAAIKAAAQEALNIRTQQLSSEIDNSDLGGKSIAQPRGGGTFNPENRFAPRPSQGEPAAAGTANAGVAAGGVGAVEQEPRKGQGAPTTTGRPITDASIGGTPNDRTASAGTARSDEEVRKATT